ncbi:MAG: outer membrane beta-barrel protein [Prevotellaceae bacterium]|jgi:hypothetical protein|nr:outer membrane beta-barrel protein [Prevotellaceae bacterium]
MKKIIFLVQILLLWGNVTIAATKFGHDISGNFNVLNASMAPVPSENNRFGIGFGGGLGYSWHINHSLSIRTGLNANYYRSTIGSEGITQTEYVEIPQEWDWGYGTGFTFEAELDKYLAQQSAFYVQLPLLVEFSSMFRGVKYLSWYAAGGVKMGYAVSGRSNAELYNLATTADLIYENVPVDDYPRLGIGTFEKEYSSATLDLGFQAIGYLELGFKQQLTEKHTLYAGFFGEYCLYNTINAARPSMLEYEPLPVVDGANDKLYQFRYNPLANVVSSGVKKTYPLAFGITIRLGYSLVRIPKQRNDRLFNVRYFQF